MTPAERILDNLPDEDALIVIDLLAEGRHNRQRVINIVRRYIPLPLNMLIDALNVIESELRVKRAGEVK